MDHFVALLRRKYPRRFAHRSQALARRVVTLIQARLLPHRRRPGPKQKPHISRAAELVVMQNREIRQGQRRQIHWLPIAEECIPGFAKIRSDPLRRKLMDQLRNSTYQRLKRLRPRRALTIAAAGLSR